MRISDWSSDVCSSDLQDSEKAGAGGWLQHAVGRRATRSGQRGNAERKRRRKLLEGLALLRSACVGGRSEEHSSELQSLMRISYAVFCLKNKKTLDTNFLCLA